MQCSTLGTCFVREQLAPSVKFCSPKPHGRDWSIAKSTSASAQPFHLEERCLNLVGQVLGKLCRAAEPEDPGSCLSLHNTASGLYPSKPQRIQACWGGGRGRSVGQNQLSKIPASNLIFQSFDDEPKLVCGVFRGRVAKSEIFHAPNPCLFQ